MNTLCAIAVVLGGGGEPLRDPPERHQQAEPALAVVSDLPELERFTLAVGFLPALHDGAAAADGTSIECENSTNEEMLGFLGTLHGAMHRYPRRLLRETLGRVYLVHALRIGERRVDSVAFGPNIAIDIGREGTIEERRARVAANFHRGVVEQLLTMNEKKIDWERWSRCLSAGFEYKTGNPKVQLHAVTVGMLMNGLASTEAHTSARADIASIAIRLMSGDQRFWEWADKSVALDRKVEFVVDFLHAVDPLITRESLRKEAFENHGQVEDDAQRAIEAQRGDVLEYERKVRESNEERKGNDGEEKPR